MFRAILASLFFLFANLNLNAQFVAINDAGFKHWLVNNGFASCLNGNLLDTTCNNILSIDSIDCTFSIIGNLNGIQYFDNLEFIDCSFNLLTSLPILPSSLKGIRCSNNNLTALTMLPPNLIYLNCQENAITQLPTLPLTIQHLNCIVNLIDSLPSLPQSLINLDCAYNQLTSLPTLPSNLKVLSCYRNQINTLPVLPPTLEGISAGYNNLTLLPTLPQSLLWLQCDANHLTTLPNLPSGLIAIDCDHNQLPNLPILPGSLVHLYCENNLLDTLPALPSLLYTLNCKNNKISNLPPLPLSIKYLNIDQNHYLTCLPIMHNLLDFTFDSTIIRCTPNSFTVNGSPFSMPICATPAQTGPITGTLLSCPGSSLTYSISLTTNAHSYIWTLPNGWQGNSTTNSIEVITGNSGGTISVKGVNSCALDTGLNNFLAVTVDTFALNIPDSIVQSGGVSKVCPGDIRTFSTQWEPNILYNWALPNGSIILSGNGTNTISVLFDSTFVADGIVKVSKRMGICTSKSFQIRLNRNKPPIPSPITGNSNGLCNVTKAFSVQYRPGFTHHWTIPQGATLVSSQDADLILVNFSSQFNTGSILVNSFNSCGASSARSIKVTSNPSAPSSILGPSVACYNQNNITFSTPLIASASSYNWIVPPGSSIVSGQSTNSIIMQTGNNSGLVRVRSINNCSASRYSIKPLIINCREAADNIPNNILVFPNPSTSFFNVELLENKIENYNIQVSNMLGEVVFQSSNLKGGQPIELGKEFSNGIYNLTLTQGFEKKSIKLLKY